MHIRHLDTGHIVDTGKQTTHADAGAVATHPDAEMPHESHRELGAALPDAHPQLGRPQPHQGFTREMHERMEMRLR